MTRTKLYTAFNHFFHTEEVDSNSLLTFRKAYLWINNTKILASSLLSYKVKNTFVFRLNRILQDSYLLTQTPPPTGVLDSLLLEAINTSIKTLTVKTANIDETNTNDTDYNILLGKIHPEKFLADQSLLSATVQMSLSNIIAYRLVGQNQPIFLYALMSFDLVPGDAPTIQVFATFEFTDGSIFLQELAVLADAANLTVYQFSGSIALLTAHLPTAQQSLTLACCTIWFNVIIGTVTTKITPDSIIIPDYQYYPDEQTIIYQNPFGLHESIRFTGQITRENEIFSETILNQGNETNISSRFRKKITMQLGIDNAQNTEAIIDDLSASNVIYWLTNGNLIPLVKDFKSLKSFDSTTQVDSPTLDFKLPYEY